MSDFTDYMENNIMNWMKGITFPAAPANTYVALFATAPTETGTAGSEVTGSIRPAGRLPASFGAITAGAISNTSDINFGASAANVTVSHTALMDAASGGNMLAHKALGVSLVLVIGNPVVIPVGALTFSVA